jgi:hypothetical protein
MWRENFAYRDGTNQTLQAQRREGETILKRISSNPDIYQRINLNTGSFETWCWRRKQISLTDCVKKLELLHITKEERNMLQTIKLSKAN